MPNRLADETSPYLLQHADNPVDWYPWGEEALERARREDKPILLSIGYSACHWCHVMAHESFEDGEVAAAMNERFVNIKVDREERPDLDQIYQLAHALLSRRSGGWPLTMFLTPDGEPFHGGTYYPKQSRYGVPGFLDLLPRIADAWRDQRDAIAAQNGRLKEALVEIEPGAPGDADATGAAAAEALAALKQSFDPVWGGFGTAPKFPHAAELEFCLEQYERHGDADARRIVELTLRRMAEGGIHDQLGGGFCRYSVDGEWAIPHFEKMLYDNGPLLALYADMARVSGEARFAASARGIVAWLTREMCAEDGALYSSLDADSEGEEGKFYVWTAAAVRALLPPEQYPLVARHYGLDGPPNFEGHAWNLRISVPLDDAAAELAIDLPDAQTRLVAAKATLFAAREKRVHPGRDDKILTSWNALAIAGLARAARALDEPGWADLAIAATDALRATAWRDGRLLATRKEKRAHLNAYLDDHAFLLAALIEVLQARFRRVDLDWATALADALLARFADSENGGFFFTSHDHERLIHRMKPGPDNATPSGNGVAARALIALGHLLAEPPYVEAGERAVRLFADAMARSPSGFATLHGAAADAREPSSFVLLVGDATEAMAWQRTLEKSYRPRVRVFNVAGIDDLPPALIKGKPPAHGAAAWVCQGTQCLPRVDSLAELLRTLDAAPAAARQATPIQ